MHTSSKLNPYYGSSSCSSAVCFTISGQKQSQDLSITAKKQSEPAVTDTKEKEQIIKTLKAAEGYVLFTSIAMGIIQMLCLKYGGIVNVPGYRYLRTPPSGDIRSQHDEVFAQEFIPFYSRTGQMNHNKKIPVERVENHLLIS